MSKEYPLEERTYKFSQSVIGFVKKIKPSIVNNPLISQVVRSSTSIGANYVEANNASSKKDFQNKIFICKKEAQETKYWLRLIADNNLELENEASELVDEVQQLSMIFQKIISTMRNGK